MGVHQKSIGIESIKNESWKGSRILDIGCGDGKLSLEVLNRTGAKELVGIDIDPKEIEKAKKISDERISFFVGDAANLQFEDESFNRIFCNISFQQFLDKEKSLEEMFRVLKKRGLILINFIEEISPVLEETLDILEKDYNISLKKNKIKISKEEFEKISKDRGFSILKSTSKKDTFFFEDIAEFLRGYSSTIDSKTKKLSENEKEEFMQKLRQRFLDKKTSKGIPDTWKIVVAKLLK